MQVAHSTPKTPKLGRSSRETGSVLSEVSTAIAPGLEELKRDEGLRDTIDEEEEFPVGRLLTRLHTRRERNSKLGAPQEKGFVHLMNRCP